VQYLLGRHAGLPVLRVLFLSLLSSLVGAAGAKVYYLVEHRRERPPLLSAVHENIAWHTYRWRLLDMPGHYLYYGKYLCRQWNWRAPKGKRLLNFQMDYVQEISKPAGQPQSLERRTAWYHDCRPGQVEEEKQQQRERREDPMELDRKRPV